MLKERHSVTSFLESENEILILQRSQHVSTSRGKWGGVSGNVEADSTADEQALVEIEEETGLSREDVALVRKGEPMRIYDERFDLTKVIHPYLFHIEDRSKIRIDWEHTQVRWIKPDDMGNYDTMPRLKETLARVLV
ncbi:NUDIX domain-containing protein [Chloroflexota bacterium]